MLTKEKILNLGKKNNGIITSKMVSEAGLSRKVLAELESSGVLTRVERGIYMMDFGYADDYFLLQHRFPNGVYSHETALFLLGYSDRVPIMPQMTFPYGFHSTRAKKAGLIPIISKQDTLSGIVTIKRSGGTTIKVYEIERTLIDLLKPKYDADKEQFLPALKRYLQSNERDITKLMDFARMFNVVDKIQPYLEVLI